MTKLTVSSSTSTNQSNEVANDWHTESLKATPNPYAENAVLPSLDNLLQSVVEGDSEDEEVIFTPNSCTLAAESGDEDSRPGPHSATSARNLTASTIFYDEFYDQLRLFAPSSEVSSEEEDRVPSSQPSSVGYSSDRTDFLETRKTPCPKQNFINQPLQTGLKSRHFRVTATKPVRRTLDFGVVKSKIVKRSPPKSSKITAPEYGPIHPYVAFCGSI